MDVLVTGGAGFIGSHLVEGLVARGDHVRVLDNLATGKLENLAAVLDRIEWMEGDLRDYDTVLAAAQGREVIFHEGALPSVPRSIQKPRDTNAVNVTGTLNVLTAARDAQVRRVVIASSSSVYGNTATLPKDESMSPQPMSPYAVSKLAGELYCRTFAQLFGLSTICLRYFQVFGPRQDPSSQYSAVIPKFIQQYALRDEPYPVDGDGEQTRDFTYVENVVRANLAAADAPEAALTLTPGSVTAGVPINIASSTRISVNGLVALINELTGKCLPSVHGPARPGDVRDSYASIVRAKALLHYEPWVSFREGLERTVEWYVRKRREASLT